MGGEVGLGYDHLGSLLVEVLCWATRWVDGVVGVVVLVCFCLCCWGAWVLGVLLGIVVMAGLAVVITYLSCLPAGRGVAGSRGGFACQVRLLGAGASGGLCPCRRHWVDKSWLVWCS